MLDYFNTTALITFCIIAYLLQLFIIFVGWAADAHKEDGAERKALAAYILSLPFAPVVMPIWTTLLVTSTLLWAFKTVIK